MWQKVMVWAAGFTIVSGAAAENRIRQWSGDPNDVDINQVNAWVVIGAPGTFGFEALEVDPNDPNTVWGLGVLQEIEVDPNCPQGTVNLYIARDPNQGGGPGATDVYYLELLNAQNVTVNIAEMRVDDSLPDVAATATTGPVVAYSIDSITLDYLGDDVDCTILGDVTVSDGLTDAPTITVDGNYAATMTFVDLPALVITGDLVGDVFASGDAEWSVAVGGDLEGSFEVAGDCDPEITLEFGSISGTLTLGQTEGNPFAAYVMVDDDVANASEIDLPAGLDAGGAIDADGTWSGTLTCSADLAGGVGAYAFDESAWVHVTGSLSGILRCDTDLQGTIDASEVTGLIDVVDDLEAELYTGDIADGAEVTIGQDFSGYIEADDLAGTLDVGRDYLGVIWLDGDIASSGALTVTNNWGTTNTTAWLGVSGSVDGDFTVTGDVVNGDIELGYVGKNVQSTTVDFEQDFAGYLLIPHYIGVFSAVQIGDDALPVGTEGWIYVGSPNDASSGIVGSLSVADELRIPLQVRRVASSGEIEIGSVPAPMAGGLDSLGVYGELEGSISVTGELDGECVIYVVADGGRLDVGGDMTALFEIKIYDPELEGYIDAGGVVHIEGAMSGGYAIDNIYEGGSLEAGSITSSGMIYQLAGSVLVEGDVTGDCTIDAFASSGSFEIDGELAADYTIYQLAGSVLVEGDVTGDCAIDAFASSGSFGIDGELAADHRMDVNGDIPGTITIGELSGTLDATDWLTSAGVLDIGDVDGLLRCQDGAEGTINVGNVTGTVNVGGPVPVERSVTTARITVAGSIGSSAQVIVGDLTDPGDANNPLSGGYVIVNGSLESGGQIIAREGLASDTAFIAINYAGGTEASWEPNSPVKLEHGLDPDEVFYSNTPSRRIWGISICRGDLNGDEVVDLNDVSPFIMGLSYPETYSVTFPGLGGTAADDYLGGSRIWKGDCNCDGSYNTSDVTPFVTLVSNNCCDPNCPGCEDQDGGGGLPEPEELAKQLADNIWPELYDDLVAVIGAAIEGLPDDESQAYWQAVYAALTE